MSLGPHEQNEAQARALVVRVGQWMHARGWIAAGDGNVSVRLGVDRVLITPTGKHKGWLTEDDLLLVDQSGDIVRGRGQPSGELAMHLALYARRPDVGAVVHAHPPACIALTLAGISMEEPVLPELVLDLGPVATAPYATPTTAQVPEAVAPWLGTCRALLLDRHGSLTCGVTLLQAYERLERLEHGAEVLLRAHSLGRVEPMTAAMVRRLAALREPKSGEKLDE